MINRLMPAPNRAGVVLSLLTIVVLQGCSDWPKGTQPMYDDPTPVFSGFIAVYAEAIALLAEYGLVADLTDNGGRVVSGTLLPVGESAKVLKTGPWAEKGDAVLPSASDLDAMAQEEEIRKATQE